ncbi:MAG: dihydrolipoamide dehydrogenase [Clostridiaceae bacterium BRH_c20a]|nr:MAG: dihydrolipoamide dehydrogenase [Clostridiaceae bacterium BRH_c20a]
MIKQPSITIIGGGPGGYVAAIRAAQLGADVTLVEKKKLGGTCLNVGCIPTKVLLHTAEIYKMLERSNELGLAVGMVKIELLALMTRKKYVVDKLINGVDLLMRTNGIKVIYGTASFENPKEIKVKHNDGKIKTIKSDYYILATGSKPYKPPIEGIDFPGVITSTEALDITEIYDSMIIVGGGVIGVEFASIYASFGCNVTIVEMMPEILPNMDEEMVNILKRKLIKDGIQILNSAKVIKIVNEGSGLNVIINRNGLEIKINAHKVLVAVGREINTMGLGLENTAVKMERSKIIVNDKLETNDKIIYAIGDCTGINMLAHVASAQGIIAAENIMGLDVKMDYKTVPSCIYTTPEMASVGLTENQARAKGYELNIGKFPLVGNGKSIIIEETEGLIKVISEKKYGEILGLHIVGPRATDLIAVGALALRLEATVDEIISTIHAHPTIGESILEASLDTKNLAIHIPAKTF